MTAPSAYPQDYRAHEIRGILAAIDAGECVSLTGLSGAGKSNLLTHLARSHSTPGRPILLIDGNRLGELSGGAILRLIHDAAAGAPAPAGGSALAALEAALHRRLDASAGSLCLALDLSMPFSRAPELAADPALNGNLRALRDGWKYRLTCIIATRRALPPHTELSELCYAHNIQLGPLAESDARWTIDQFCRRRGISFEPAVIEALLAATRGYPSLLRAACEAGAAGAGADAASLAAHPAVQKRLEEFRADEPTEEEIRASGLEGLPLLKIGRAPRIDTDQLTAKELLLLECLQAHAGEICPKDDLIRAVWPEDQVFERGVRDDSLAQLVRRLREKVETDASRPEKIQTVAGRGYRFSA
ncbi:MAG: winged helix-turn-helix domain-containing protein [Anaerolineales bacterium]|nr:winged helix-turn-helix domain-containing protein [Anaerolineales bacterium]